MIPQLPNLDGYIEIDGKQLRTPLQQIEKNKDDIAELQENTKDIASKANYLYVMNAQGSAYMTPFWKETAGHPEYQYQPYIPNSNEAHGWFYESGTWSGGTTTGHITNIPHSPTDADYEDNTGAHIVYWGVRIINASDNNCTIYFDDCVMNDEFKTLSQVVRLASQNASSLNFGHPNEEGARTFYFNIKSRSSVYVYGRTLKKPNGVLQSQYFII